MLQITYNSTNASIYTFYVDTADNRFDNSKTDDDNYVYLFKFTNDMSGEIQYAYVLNYGLFNRYSRLQLTQNSTPTYYLGTINPIPNGYYGYELFEYSGDITTGATCPTVPNPATDVINYWNMLDASGTIDATGNVTTSNTFGYDITDLDTDTYGFDFYDNCKTLIQEADGFEIVNYTTVAFALNSNDKVPLKVELISQGNSANFKFRITSNMTGSATLKYTMQQGSGATGTANITTSPQVDDYTYPVLGDPNAAANRIELILYNGTAVLGKHYIYPQTDPTTKYGYVHPIILNPKYTNSSATPGSPTEFKGNLVVNAIAGTTAYGATKGYYSLNGKLTSGKMYVEEESGNEQVQYTQHPEPSGTNYIYYGQ